MHHLILGAFVLLLSISLYGCKANSPQYYDAETSISPPPSQMPTASTAKTINTDDTEDFDLTEDNSETASGTPSTEESAKTRVPSTRDASLKKQPSQPVITEQALPEPENF